MWVVFIVALIASLENTLPLVKLGQADNWQPDPRPSRIARLVGWKAIALPVICQLIAAGIQLYVLFFHEIAESERVIAVLIMGLVVVQLWVSRPRD